MSEEHPESPIAEETPVPAPAWFEQSQAPATPQEVENLRILTDAIDEAAQTFDMAHYLRLFGGPAAMVDVIQPLPH